MIGGQPKQNAIMALLLTRSLMLKYEWRVSFATEGGVKAILSCMQEYPSCTRVQQIALAVSSLLKSTCTHALRDSLLLYFGGQEMPLCLTDWFQGDHGSLFRL